MDNEQLTMDNGHGSLFYSHHRILYSGDEESFEALDVCPWNVFLGTQVCV